LVAQAADIAFSGGELAALVRSAVVPLRAGRRWLSALVFSHPVRFGASRQCQAFAQSYSRDAIFSDIEAAKAWLLMETLDA
jgi:hypothetical protein